MAYLQPAPYGITNQAPFYGSDPFIYGFDMTITGNTTFTIQPGVARAFSSDALIQIPANRLGESPITTIDISTVGALGCYPKSIATAGLTDYTTLNVYVIGSSSGLKLPTFVVATGDQFILPGYDIWRKVNTVYVNNSTGFLVPLTQVSNGKERWFVLNEPILGVGFGPTTFSLYPLSTGLRPCNPYFTTEALFTRYLTPATVTDYASISSNNSSVSARPSFTMVSPALSQMRDQIWVPVGKTGTDAAVYISVVGAGANFTVSDVGWKENMGLQAV